jgi:hypothetical protein
VQTIIVRRTGPCLRIYYLELVEVRRYGLRASPSLFTVYCHQCILNLHVALPYTLGILFSLYGAESWMPDLEVNGKSTVIVVFSKVILRLLLL